MNKVSKRTENYTGVGSFLTTSPTLPIIFSLNWFSLCSIKYQLIVYYKFPESKLTS